MKRLLSLLLPLLLLCTPALAESFVTPEQTQNISVGAFATMVTEEKTLQIIRKLGGDKGFEGSTLVFVESMTDALLALKSGKIGAFITMVENGDYLIARNPEIVKSYTHNDHILRMIFAPGQQAWCDRFSEALVEMKHDGMLEAIHKEWILDLPVGEEPSAEPMPVAEGGETVRVGVSGDLPPFDYISAGGVPSGYNVAVLSEIVRRTGLNIELVEVSTGSRSIALISGRIDAFFWVHSIVAREGSGTHGGTDTPEELTTPIDNDYPLTEPYYRSPAVMLFMP